jgi:stage II sporulation protein D
MVDIEDYLKGVLPAEIGDRSPDEFEAVKAQAVAARTYAIWKLTDNESSGKLVPTVADQVYSGLDSEKELLIDGIEQTSGIIMTYDGGPIAAYYHAVCGGHTASVEKIWPEKRPRAYLIGVEDENFCSWARTFSWTETYDTEQLERVLRKYFADKSQMELIELSGIKDVEFSIDGESDRVEMMEVTAANTVYRETCDKIRWALERVSSPGAILPSTKFTFEKKFRDGYLASLKLSGLGNGHGVGMCQCGAIGRARAGDQFESILHHYYGPIEFTKLY